MPLAPPPANGEVVRGWTDIPLTSKGEHEAERLGRDLEGRGLDMLYCSDLERAAETAKILEKKLKIPLVGESRDLRTWNPGELEGEPFEETKGEIQYYINHPNEAPKDAETFNHFLHRVVRKFVQVHNITWPKGIVAGIVAHHWTIEAIQGWIKAGAKPNFQVDKKNLFMQGEAPGSVYDVWGETGDGKLEIKLIDVERDKKYRFRPGVVLIRHASTAWNVGGGKG
jgi:broad specificity phosphatase PhoE